MILMYAWLINESVRMLDIESIQKKRNCFSVICSCAVLPPFDSNNEGNGHNERLKETAIVRMIKKEQLNAKPRITTKNLFNRMEMKIEQDKSTTEKQLVFTIVH